MSRSIGSSRLEKCFSRQPGNSIEASPEPCFQSSKRQDVSVVGRLRSYADFTENSNVDIGFSYARGRNDLGSNFVH